MGERGWMGLAIYDCGLQIGEEGRHVPEMQAGTPALLCELAGGTRALLCEFAGGTPAVRWRHRDHGQDAYLGLRICDCRLPIGDWGGEGSRKGAETATGELVDHGTLMAVNSIQPSAGNFLKCFMLVTVPPWFLLLSACLSP
jgi:hypothetical protein